MLKKGTATPTVSRRQASKARGENIRRALDKALDPLGPFKEGIFLTLAIKYGITFTDDNVPVKEIEDLLFILFERGAQPLVQSFRNNLALKTKV